jgi:outer membrane protein assembly factor BamB
MTSVTGRTIAQRAVGLLLVLLVTGSNGFADEQVPDQDPRTREILQLITGVEQSISSAAWLDAADGFDSAWRLVCDGEDPMLTLNQSVSAELKPGEHEVLAGARSRLEALYRNAPDNFRNTYEQQFRQLAEQSILDAWKSTDTTAVKQVVQRFRFTSAARAAASSLVELSTSRGDFLEAALQTESRHRLLQTVPESDQIRLIQLWWLAGLAEEAVDLLRDFVAAYDAVSVAFNGRTVQLPADDGDLPGWLAAEFGQRMSTGENWLQPGGDYRRNQRQAAGPANAVAEWSASAFECQMNAGLNPLLQRLSGPVREAVGRAILTNNTIAPVAHPVVADDLVVYRAAANLRAVDRRSGELVWESGGIDRELMSAANRLRDRTDEDSDIEQLVRIISPQLFNYWVRANVGGQLTTNGEFVFSIEDVSSATWTIDLDDRPPGIDRSHANYLRVYELATGRLRGQAGAAEEGVGRGLGAPLSGMYFLGAPLVMGERIYVLAENSQGIYLLQLKASLLRGRPADAELDLRPVHSQLLCVPKYGLEDHPVRKYCGVSPSFGRGLLICSTCNEEIIAISADDHSVRWVYRYPGSVTEAELGAGQPVIGNAMSPDNSVGIDFESRWIDSLPRVTSNRVLLTPRDSDRMFCLDLQTGRQLWSRPRGAMRSIGAVTNDRVVLVGTTSVEAVRLEDGAQIWRTELVDGRVCGTAATNGRVLRVPTSEPSIVTVDVESGRVLVKQRLQGGKLPGNLVCLGEQLFSQSFTEMTAYSANEQTAGQVLPVAQQKLLDGDIDGAVSILKNAVESSAANQQGTEARQLLIEVLLESLRLDYGDAFDQMAYVRGLINESTPSHSQIEQLVTTMLGVNPLDASQLPYQWRQVTRTQQQLDRLHDTATDGLITQIDLPLETLATQIIDLLDMEGADRVTRAGTVTRRRHRHTADVVQSVIAALDSSQQQRLLQLLTPQIQERMLAESASPRFVNWLQLIHLSGLAASIDPQALVAVESVDLPGLDLATEQILASASQSPDVNTAGNAVTCLLDHWLKTGRVDSVQEFIARSSNRSRVSESDLQTTGAVLRWLRLENHADKQAALADWQARHETELQTEPLPWSGRPQVVESAARTSSGPASTRRGSPGTNLPLFGSSGAFGRWSFVQLFGEQEIEAYDSRGRLRWKFDPGVLFSRLQDQFQWQHNKISTRYLLACGHLLAVKLNNMLFVLDCSGASVSDPPVLLWELNLSTALPEETRSQQFGAAWQRTTQYDIQPAGLFPVGPLTAAGLPVYSGQQLIVLNPLTGQREWQVDGIPSDCTLTGDEQDLCLISESSGQVEVRSMVDGSVRQLTTLPDWWVAANENSNAAMGTFELEPGEVQPRKVKVTKGSVAIFQMSTEAAELHSYSLEEGRTVWRKTLPQNSLCSNAVDGVVATLSDGHDLRLMDLESGAELARLDVPAAAECAWLYLRPGPQGWLVLTDVSGDPTDEDDINRPMDSVKVNGWIYAIDESDYSLAWSVETTQEFMRVLTPAQAPMMPSAPVLVLLQRPRNPRLNEFAPIGARYSARILSTATGEVLYSDDNLGATLNSHMLKLDQQTQTIEVGFDVRSVSFVYGKSADVQPEPDDN